MKIFKRIFSIVLIVLLSLSFISCKKAVNQVSAVDFNYFNTFIHIETYNKKITDEVKGELNQLFKSLDDEFNVKTGTFTKVFNEEIGNITLSDRAKEVLTLAKKYYSFTDEKFNIAILPLLNIWGFSDNYPINNFTLPLEQDLISLVNSDIFNLNSVLIDDNIATKLNPKIKLDFGGMLKGYASEKAKDILNKNGYFNGYVNVGGSSLTLLEINSLFVRHPEHNASNILFVNTVGQKNISLSTSGTYERYYEYENKTYHHILNAKTGNPANTNILCATMFGKDGAFCDAMTTALILSSFEKDNDNCELVNLIKKIISYDSNCQIYVVYNDGENKLLITNKEQGINFTLLDTSYSVYKV